MTDEELVSKIISSNNTELFGVLYDRFSKVIYNKCYSFVNDQEEAKDLTQDIFLKLYVKLSSFQGKSKFSTWVYSFTYNHCVNYVSRNPAKKYETRLSESYDLENFSDCSVDIIDLNEEEKVEEKLNYALNGLSADDKSILVLKYQNNLSIKNLEGLLGIGSSAVKMRIKRARERLSTSYQLVS
ncbi:sigma-70 family RNA polymerase sigma factor [uncultured Algibacter sp.]|uniref:RNA polymerase sigma factor n=1 Tax=uncultured Algibacter sp. TaxID=298659 RepID=UPI00261FF4AA|nr:sigma-70 family RNA polymerase sigma factor [uncultured Algibacter sp.]